MSCARSSGAARSRRIRRGCVPARAARSGRGRSRRLPRPSSADRRQRCRSCDPGCRAVPRFRGGAPRPPDLATPRSRRCTSCETATPAAQRRAHVHVHQTPALRRTTSPCIDGMPVTTLARTVADLGRSTPLMESVAIGRPGTSIGPGARGSATRAAVDEAMAGGAQRAHDGRLPRHPERECRRVGEPRTDGAGRDSRARAAASHPRRARDVRRPGRLRLGGAAARSASSTAPVKYGALLKPGQTSGRRPRGPGSPRGRHPARRLGGRSLGLAAARPARRDRRAHPGGLPTADCRDSSRVGPTVAKPLRLRWCATLASPTAKSRRSEPDPTPRGL